MRLPYEPSLQCSACSKDSYDLVHFLSWLVSRHKCQLVKKVNLLKEKLILAIEYSDDCVCGIEEKFYEEAHAYSNCRCCI